MRDNLSETNSDAVLNHIDAIQNHIDEQIQNNIDAQTHNQIDAQIENHINGQIQNQINGQIENQLNEEIQYQINGEIQNHINGAIEYQISGEMGNVITGEIQYQISAEVANQIDISALLQNMIQYQFTDNGQGIEVFLAHCDQAYQYVAEEDKPSLLEFIKSKITGRAKQQLANQEFESWEELREYLKTFYENTNADRRVARANFDQKVQEMDMKPMRFEICAVLLFNDDMDYVEMRSIKARNNRFRLMIDTGSSVNLIKLSSITPDVEIDGDEKILLTNITLNQHFETSGSCWIPLIVDNRRINVKFYIMDQQNNVPGDGLLGTEFMETEKVTINYGDRTLILNTIHKTLDMHRT